MVHAFSISDIGQKRVNNQDSVFCSETPVGPLPNLFIVADGMGGHKGGEFASLSAVETMQAYIQKSKEASPVLIFKEAINGANTSICARSFLDEELEGMGTTVVAASCIGDKLQVANVGDSRLYIVNDTITQITVDHSLVEEMVRMGSLDRSLARSHPSRNIITRAIGVGSEVHPDYFTVTLKAGDIILMCSDGLTNMLSDEEILAIVSKEGELEAKTNELLLAANHNGGLDNISVILIDPSL